MTIHNRVPSNDIHFQVHFTRSSLMSLGRAMSNIATEAKRGIVRLSQVTG